MRKLRGMSEEAAREALRDLQSSGKLEVCTPMEGRLGFTIYARYSVPFWGYAPTWGSKRPRLRRCYEIMSTAAAIEWLTHLERSNANGN